MINAQAGLHFFFLNARNLQKCLTTDTFIFFSQFPRVGTSPLVTRTPEFGEMENISTEEMYKLTFNFANAKPEDVNVTLKGKIVNIVSKSYWFLCSSSHCFF